MTHDALLYYWENKRRLPADTDVLGYILLSVKNKCLNYLKHLQIEIEYGKNYTELYDWEIATRIQTLEDGHGQGKKLGFIAQEMGREINTLGSKSNHAEMQKIVVQMKDELEQIKEQVLNVM